MGGKTSTSASWSEMLVWFLMPLEPLPLSSPQSIIHIYEIFNEENESAPCFPRWHDHKMSWMPPPKYRLPSRLRANYRKCRGQKATFSALILFFCVYKRIHVPCREFFKFSTKETLHPGSRGGLQAACGTLTCWENAFISPSHRSLICKMVTITHHLQSCWEDQME